MSELIALLKQIAASQAQTNELLAKLVSDRNIRAQVSSEWLSITQAARVAGLSTKTVRRAVHKGNLRATPTVPNARRPTWRIARIDLDAFMNANAAARPVDAASPKSNGKYKSRHFTDL
jgi:excisionase family DNA binding protein